MKLNSVLLIILFMFCAAPAWSEECRVDTSDVSFGNYEPFSNAHLDATGKVTVVCDGVFPFVVKLDQGRNSGGSFNPRILKTVGKEGGLKYNLFTDSARQIIWGNGTGNTFIGSGTANRAQTWLTVYGRIPAGQIVTVGRYADRIQVMVEW